MNERDQGFTDYFASRSSAMRGTAFLLCGDWHRAEDLVQNAFVKLYRAWSRIEAPHTVDAYTRQILVRTYLGETRRGFFFREKVTAEQPERTASPAGSLEDRLVLLRALAGVRPGSARCWSRASGRTCRSRRRPRPWAARPAP